MLHIRRILPASWTAVLWPVDGRDEPGRCSTCHCAALPTAVVEDVCHVLCRSFGALPCTRLRR